MDWLNINCLVVLSRRTFLGINEGQQMAELLVLGNRVMEQINAGVAGATHNNVNQLASESRRLREMP